MTILITGGGGFIGSHLAEKFRSEDYEVSIIDNFSTGKQNITILKDHGVNIIKDDIRNYETLKNAIKNSQTIVHIAAMNRAPRSIENPLESNDININATLNILEYARKYGNKVLFASSSSVFGSLEIQPRPENEFQFKPLHPYGLGKLTSEFYMRQYSELYGLETNIVRYFAVYGPRQSPTIKYSAVIPIFIKNFIDKKPITIHGGNQTRNFTYIKDNVEATYTLATNKPSKFCYNVGGKEEISINQLYATLVNIFGYEVPIINEEFRKGDLMRSVPKMENLKDEFNFTPNYNIIEGLEETIEWMKNNANYFSK